MWFIDLLRIFSTIVGGIVIAMWLLGALSLADFVLIFRVMR